MFVSDSDVYVGLNTDSEKEHTKKYEVNYLKCEKNTSRAKPKCCFIKKTDGQINFGQLFIGDNEILKKNIEKGEKKRENDNSEEGNNTIKRKPVWYDEDDDDSLKINHVIFARKHIVPLNHINKEKSYKSYLTKKYKKIVCNPKWADFNKEEVNSDEEILKTIGHLASVEETNLSAEHLSNKKLKDLNRATYSEGPITNINFHPNSTVALVSGQNGVGTVYSIDGLKNEKLHSMEFKNFPIKCTKLLTNGFDVIFGSVCNYFYTYDLIATTATRVFLPKSMTTLKHFEISADNNYIASAGRFGEIFLLDMRSKELIYTYKQDDQCSAIKFTHDSTKILTHSRNSSITIFDIRQQKVEHIFNDDGCINGKCLALSPDSNLLATGSNEGVVNIYNYSEVFRKRSPVPQKVICNLKTSITELKFNHTGEILGLCSKKVQNGIKLVHFPTAKVYANFPDPQAKFGKINRLEFSPHSGFLALGNFEGQVPLLRIKHFKNY